MQVVIRTYRFLLSAVVVLDEHLTPFLSDHLALMPRLSSLHLDPRTVSQPRHGSLIEPLSVVEVPPLLRLSHGYYGVTEQAHRTPLLHPILVVPYVHPWHALVLRPLIGSRRRRVPVPSDATVLIFTATARPQHPHGCPRGGDPEVLTVLPLLARGNCSRAKHVRCHIASVYVRRPSCQPRLLHYLLVLCDHHPRHLLTQELLFPVLLHLAYLKFLVRLPVLVHILLPLG